MKDIVHEITFELNDTTQIELEVCEPVYEIQIYQGDDFFKEAITVLQTTEAALNTRDTELQAVYKDRYDELRHALISLAGQLWGEQRNFFLGPEEPLSDLAYFWVVTSADYSQILDLRYSPGI